MSLVHQLQADFPHISWSAEEPLAPFTTVRIGGPAEAFARIKNRHDLESLAQYAQARAIPFTVLGWGANTLIADRGLRGIVVRNESSEIIVHDTLPSDISEAPVVQARWGADDTHGTAKYDFSDLEYSEENAPRVLVTLDSGVSLPMAINILLAQGITGLQWYARIPASIGGAIYNNIHGGTHFISEVLHSVRASTKDGTITTIPVADLEAGYDYSRFHHSGEIIISADFLLYRGDVAKARSVAQEWAVRKKVQPQNSLGCIFQNISAAEQKRLELPTPSIGYIVEHVLKLQQLHVGDALVSSHHAAFIENRGSATAAEYLEVIRTIITAAREQLSITLHPEIFFLGFTAAELTGIVPAKEGEL